LLVSSSGKTILWNHLKPNFPAIVLEFTNDADVAWVWDILCRFKPQDLPLIPFPENRNLSRILSDLLPMTSKVKEPELDLYFDIYASPVAS
jgi:hypothetical protein